VAHRRLDRLAVLLAGQPHVNAEAPGQAGLLQLEIHLQQGTAAAKRCALLFFSSAWGGGGRRSGGRAAA
jgi:hypothetical protein